MTVKVDMRLLSAFTANSQLVSMPAQGVNMRPELAGIMKAIAEGTLPISGEDLFGQGWAADKRRFTLQETYVIDFKLNVPDKFAEDYGAGIVRLALAMYNSYGGVIVFGVLDKEQTLVGADSPFPIEAFNRVLSDCTGRSIECIARSYALDGVQTLEVAAVLIPRRGATAPAVLTSRLGPYPKGSLWVRDRHEARIADAMSLPMLYSSRVTLPAEAQQAGEKSIHRSLPPPPATIHQFVGREALLTALWNWFVIGNQPRMYLHGPGGSGKSTLAYEFARTLADAGFDIILPNGDRVDYVLFITGKETELDPMAGKTRKFVLQQFDDAASQFGEILVQSGIASPDTLAEDEDRLIEQVEELFSSYNGLLVIDDIDALSRRGTDTGEETLFLKAVMGSKRTRILYTLRHPAAHARKHSLAVPGLNDEEFFTFLEACCEQFKVSVPPADQMVAISTATSNLPLLIENVIGLRKFCTSWREAIDQFNEKGGDEARRYLYQREYDQLRDAGKAREMLAALAYVAIPLDFRTLTHLFSFSDEQVRTALSECSGIFLATETGDSGDTFYTVTPSSQLFLISVSDRLDKSKWIRRKVELLVAEGAKYTPAESAVIVRLDQFIRRGNFQAVLEAADSIPTNDPILANPKVMALVGQACANLEGKDRARARECFKAASATNYRDLAMMRSWYHLERKSGYGLEEAKRIASDMVESLSSAARVRSEFMSKLADCHFTEARSLQSVSSEKALQNYRRSIALYADAVRTGGSDRGYDLERTVYWLDGVISAYARYCSDRFEDYLDVVGALDAKNDLDPRVAESIARGVLKLQIRVDRSSRPKFVGLLTRVIGKVAKISKPFGSNSGWRQILETFERFRESLEREQPSREAIP